MFRAISSRLTNRKRASLLVILLLLMLGPLPICKAQSSEFECPSIEPPPPGEAWPGVPSICVIDSGAAPDPSVGVIDDRRAPDQPGSDETATNYVIQAAEQNKDICIQNVGALLSCPQSQECSFVSHTVGGQDVITCMIMNAYCMFYQWVVEDKGFFLAIVVCVAFIPNKRCRSRSLPSIALHMICFMTFAGFACGPGSSILFGLFDPDRVSMFCCKCSDLWTGSSSTSNTVVLQQIF